MVHCYSCLGVLGLVLEVDVVMYLCSTLHVSLGKDCVDAVYPSDGTTNYLGAQSSREDRGPG